MQWSSAQVLEITVTVSNLYKPLIKNVWSLEEIKNNQNHYITPDINGASHACETGLKVLHQMLHSQPHCCPSHSVYICCLNILKLHLLKQHSSIGVLQKEPNESALSYKVVTENNLAQLLCGVRTFRKLAILQHPEFCSHSKPWRSYVHKNKVKVNEQLFQSIRTQKQS